MNSYCIKYLCILCSITLLFVSCESSNDNHDKVRSETEEAEMTSDESVMEEAVSETAAPEEISQSPFMNLPCKINNDVQLDNFYQLTEQQQNMLQGKERSPVDNYGFNVIEYAGFLLKERIENCLRSDPMSLPEACHNFFDITGEYRQNKRDDLMNAMDMQMTVVPEPVVDYALKFMIPEPTDQQANGITYQELYEFLKKDIRKAYFGLVLIKSYSSWEYEMITYAKVADNSIVLNGGTEREGRYQAFRSIMERYKFRKDCAEAIALGDSDYIGDYELYSSLWCRRGLDGSGIKLEELFQKVLKKYDSEWLERTTRIFYNNFPKIDYVKSDDSFQSKSDTMIPVEAMENYEKVINYVDDGFRINFENGNYLVLGSDEYYYNKLAGYLPQYKMLVVNHSDGEQKSTLFMRITDKTITKIPGTISSIKISPEGAFATASNFTWQGNRLMIFKVVEGKVQPVFVSSLLQAENMDWITAESAGMKTGHGGYVSIDLSGMDN